MPIHYLTVENLVIQRRHFIIQTVQTGEIKLYETTESEMKNEPRNTKVK